jgi:hypothetical protein
MLMLIGPAMATCLFILLLTADLALRGWRAMRARVAGR